MIEGIHLDITTAQLRDHLQKRITFHDNKRADYEAKSAALAGVDLSEAHSTFNPQQGLTQKVEEHRNRARVLGFMAEYLVPNETYRLSEADLARLELLDRYF